METKTTQPKIVTTIGGTKVFEVSQMQFSYAYTVLPPIFCPGFWAVDEPITHNAMGVPEYACYKQFRGKHYGWDSTLAEGEKVANGLAMFITGGK